MGDTRLSGCMPCVWASCVTDTVSELMPPHAIWGEFPNSGAEDHEKAGYGNQGEKRKLRNCAEKGG